MIHDDTGLRKALDATDRHRWRLMIAFAVYAAATLWFFYQFQQIEQDGNVRRMLLVSVSILCFWIGTVGIAIVLQMVVMTKRILRAIELTGR